MDSNAAHSKVSEISLRGVCVSRTAHTAAALECSDEWPVLIRADLVAPWLCLALKHWENPIKIFQTIKIRREVPELDEEICAILFPDLYSHCLDSSQPNTLHCRLCRQVPLTVLLSAVWKKESFTDYNEHKRFTHFWSSAFLSPFTMKNHGGSEWLLPPNHCGWTLHVFFFHGTGIIPGSTV